MKDEDLLTHAEALAWVNRAVETAIADYKTKLRDRLRFVLQALEYNQPFGTDLRKDLLEALNDKL